MGLLAMPSGDKLTGIFPMTSLVELSIMATEDVGGLVTYIFPLAGLYAIWYGYEIPLMVSTKLLVDPFITDIEPE
jgi:hypothetical protein